MAKHCLFVPGELDIATAPELHADLRRAIVSDSDGVVFGLRRTDVLHALLGLDTPYD
jgi:hypothetical protein